jgi:ubiquinone biosynthesis protein COQ9
MPKSQTGMIDVYIQEVDRALEAYFTPERIAGMKIRERIRALIWRRLEVMGPAREAVRRALAILAMPQNLAFGLRVGCAAPTSCGGLRATPAPISTTTASE